jgi:hypothetical protein
VVEKRAHRHRGRWARMLLRRFPFAAHFRLRPRAKAGATIASATLPKAARMPTLSRLELSSI